MMELNRIHNIPCAGMFAGLEEQAALIIADPPYGIGYKAGFKTRAPKKGKERNSGGDRTAPFEFEGDKTIDLSWINPAYDALKEGGAMYLFTRWDVLHHWHSAVLEAGFKVAQCLVWDKMVWGAGDLRYYGSQTENILVCLKGPHRMRWDGRQGNVWRVSRGTMLSQDGGGKHPTQKPTRLFRRIIQYSSDPGDLILDPFTGSGAACIAAQRLHRRFIGCDISPTFASAAQEWIETDARTSSLVRTVPMF